MKNIVWHNTTISKEDRSQLLKQKPFVLWFTGLSASGKSTIANLVEKEMIRRSYKTYLLDGDNVRHGLNKDLGFDEESRVENIRRVGEVSKLLLESGIIVLTAFISPFKSDRDLVRSLFKEGQFLEVFIDSSLKVCESRDPKGMYAKARNGDIKNFTGIDDPYEKPKNPEIHLRTDEMSLEEEIKAVTDHLELRRII